MCDYPVDIVREKYRDIYNRRVIQVPCGKCLSCLKKRSSQWVFRLQQEEKVSSSACFLTLTYENTPISTNGLPTLNKKDLQAFFKRLRHKTTNKIKYYACGEYGSVTRRPHYHAIIFNLPARFLTNNNTILNTWKHGHIFIGRSNIKTMSYVSGYVTKGRFEPEGELDDRQPEFSTMSKGMGLNFITPQMKRYYHDRLLNVITLPGGKLLGMPRYYKDKIFTHFQKARMHSDYLKTMNMDFKPFIFDDPEVRNHLESLKAKERNNQRKFRLKRHKV